MNAVADTEETPPKKRTFGIVVLAGGLLVAGAAGGFLLMQSGLLPTMINKPMEATPRGTSGAFVPVDPILVSLGPAAANRHLSFRAQLEVPKKHAAAVTEMMPRFVDVLNGYLRAVDVREFDDPLGLIRMRGQMLRRIQMMAGDGRVDDLLVMEFVLN